MQFTTIFQELLCDLVPFWYHYFVSVNKESEIRFIFYQIYENFANDTSGCGYYVMRGKCKIHNYIFSSCKFIGFLQFSPKKNYHSFYR